MLEWLAAHSTLLWWMGAASLFLFLGSLILLPLIIAYLPVDFFTRERVRPQPSSVWGRILAVALLVMKNMLGAVFFVAGLAMLILPGPGIFAILAGLTLINLPGKRKLLLWCVQRRGVIASLNWVRAKWHKPPFEVGSDE